MPTAELGWVKEIRTRPEFCGEGEANGSTVERIAHPDMNTLNAQLRKYRSTTRLRESIAEK
jgi:hypothetical protein